MECFLGSVALVVGAAGDNALGRYMIVLNADEGKAEHGVGKLVAYEGEAAVLADIRRKEGRGDIDETDNAEVENLDVLVGHDGDDGNMYLCVLFSVF